MTTKLRTVLYARVSQANKAGETVSVDQQLDELRRRLPANAVEVDAQTDRGIGASGEAKHRPGWQAVLALITAGKVDAVGLWETSRSSRRLDEWVAFRDLCARHRVVWITPQGVKDPAEDTLGLGVSALVAEQEAKQLSDRIKRANSANAVAGRPHGKETYGYARHYDPFTRKLIEVVVEPHEAEVYRQIVGWALDGASLRSIAQRLNEAGEPAPATAIAQRRGRPLENPTQWNPAQLKRLLLSKAHVGIRVHVERDRLNKDRIVSTAEYAASWPALISEEDHARLTAMLTRPGRTTWTGVPGRIVHPLAGAMTCEPCGSVLQWDRKANAYRCREPRCRKVSINAPTVEQVVAKLTVTKLEQPDGEVERATSSASVELADAQRVLDEAEGRLDELTEAYTGGSIPLKAYEKASVRLEEQVREAKATLQRLARPSLPAHARVVNVREQWADWTAGEQNQVVRAMFESIVVKPAERSGRPKKGTELAEAVAKRLVVSWR